MPNKNLAHLFPLAVLSAAVASAHAAKDFDIPEGEYRLTDGSESALVIIRSSYPEGHRFKVPIEGTINLRGSLIMDNGLTASGILFDESPEPDVDVNITPSGKILIKQGLGANIKYGRSTLSNVSNRGYLYNKDSEIIRIAPDNPSLATSVIGVITNETLGIMEGNIALKLYEGDMNGDFINKGIIKTTGSSGISLHLASFYGNIINEGTWTSNGYALQLNDATSFNGNLENSGTITASEGLVRITGDSPTSDDAFANFEGSIINRSFGVMTAETGHAFEFKDMAFVGGIVNEASGSMIAREEDKALVYIGASSDSDVSANEGKITDGVTNAGLMSGYYLAWNDNLNHTLEVTNQGTGLMTGRFRGNINFYNHGSFFTERGTSLTGDFTHTGVLEFSVDSAASTTPVMDVSGTATLSSASSVVVAPDFELYNDDSRLAGESYQLLRAGTLTNSGANIQGSVLTTVNVVDDSGNTLTVTIDRKKPEEASSGSEATEAVIEAASRSKTLFDLLAGTTSKAQLDKLVQENWVNNSHATQQMNLIVQEEAVSIPLQRLSTARSFSRGVSFGDEQAGKGIWMQVLAAEASQDSRKNKAGHTLSGFDADIDGFSLGLESSLEKGFYDITYGAAFTVAGVKAEKKNSIDDNRLKNYQLSVYGSYTRDQWYLDGVLNYGRSKHERMRYVEHPDVVLSPIEADFNSNHYGLKLLAGFTYPYLNTLFQPVIGFNYSRIVSDDYREKDTGNTRLAQSVSGQTYQKIELGAGLEMSRIYEIAQGTLEPSVRIMGWYDIKGDRVKTDSILIDGGGPLNFEGAKPVRDSYSASFNLTYRRLDNLSIVLGYDRHQKSGYKSNNYTLRMKYDF
ncbi:autotransporter outer membrane beta-barrel domain-containing protein [Endozoicomonas lisbonensis]|uniref:Autotransporter domain-containing protein n=1 Tax=Endozoicomonas lisbonensis TaxID=3120522 RepID=A0ABV2SIN4_9GAMM